jgi:tetratricopeptide (TPR) repeat protein
MKALFSGRRNVFLLIGFVLIVAFVVKARIDQKEKEKALPSFEKSIETANTLLTADLRGLPGSIPLPQAEGKYSELVHNFNAAVKDYQYKLIEYKDCQYKISLMLYLTYFSLPPQAIYYCINMKKEYYESLSKLKDAYRKASKALDPTVKLITMEKDGRFEVADKFLDEVERRIGNKK